MAEGVREGPGQGVDEVVVIDCLYMHTKISHRIFTFHVVAFGSSGVQTRDVLGGKPPPLRGENIFVPIFNVNRILC